MNTEEHRPKLIGIVNLWLRNVRWLGDGGFNKHIKSGTVGDLHVSEVGVTGQVINANFHPGGEGHGYGATINPEWDYVRS